MSIISAIRVCLWRGNLRHSTRWPITCAIFANIFMGYVEQNISTDVDLICLFYALCCMSPVLNVFKLIRVLYNNLKVNWFIKYFNYSKIWSLNTFSLKTLKIPCDIESWNEAIGISFTVQCYFLYHVSYVRENSSQYHKPLRRLWS